MLTTPTATHLDLALARIAALGARRVHVFGSYARGDARPGSDIDLLVTFDRLDDKRLARRRVQEALRDLAVPFDVVTTTPEEVERRGEIVGSVLHEALRTGRTVYERAPSALPSRRRHAHA